MPQINFTRSETRRIQEILDELDPSRHELTADFASDLEPEDWEFVKDYTRAKMRTVLETGLLLRSSAELGRATQLIDNSAVRRNFLHSLWTYNFSFRNDIEEAFVEIVGAGDQSPLFAAVEALIDAAEDLMFGTFEDAHVRLLEGSAR